MVQWLGLAAFTAGAQIPSLVGELGSHKPGRVAKKRKKEPNDPLPFFPLANVAILENEIIHL